MLTLTPVGPLNQSFTKALRNNRPLQFSGKKSTDLAASTHLNAEQLQASLVQDSDPYVGSMPETLCAQTEKVPSLLNVLLDRLAQHLNTLFVHLPIQRQKFPPPTALAQTMTDVFKEEPLPIRWVGEGGNGRVFRIGAEDKPLAFKIFKDPMSLESYREAANGLYLTQLGTSDVAKFYCGNPAGRWILYEFIPTSTKLAYRPGKSLAEHGFELDDDKPANSIAGIRVDLGGNLIDLEQRKQEAFLLGKEAHSTEHDRH